MSKTSSWRFGAPFMTAWCRNDLALRQGGAPTDPRLGPLGNFARAMVRDRGRIDAPTLHAFLAAGYSKRQALDVVMGMAFSLMANYASHLTHPPLDDFLKPHGWTR